MTSRPLVAPRPSPRVSLSLAPRFARAHSRSSSASSHVAAVVVVSLALAGALSLGMMACGSDDAVIEFIGVTDAQPPRLGLAAARASSDGGVE